MNSNSTKTANGKKLASNASRVGAQSPVTAVARLDHKKLFACIGDDSEYREDHANTEQISFILRAVVDDLYAYVALADEGTPVEADTLRRFIARIGIARDMAEILVASNGQVQS